MGATNVRMLCSGGDVHDGGGLLDGDWVGYNACPPDTAVCGVRAKTQPDQGSGDDTAVNRLQLECCPVSCK